MELLYGVTLLHGCFSRFVNCANSTKSRKVSQIFFIYHESSVKGQIYFYFKVYVKL